MNKMVEVHELKVGDHILIGDLCAEVQEISTQGGPNYVILDLTYVNTGIRTDLFVPFVGKFEVIP